MRAVVQDRYGAVDEVLHLREVPVPEVAADEVLVRVRAASVHPDVWHVVTGRPYVLRLMGSGVRRPKYRIPGTDLAGQVESVGRMVKRFRVGDTAHDRPPGATAPLPLLETKLYLPRWRTGVVPMPRLVARLRERGDERLTLIESGT